MKRPHIIPISDTVHARADSIIAVIAQPRPTRDQPGLARTLVIYASNELRYQWGPVEALAASRARRDAILAALRADLGTLETEAFLSPDGDYHDFRWLKELRERRATSSSATPQLTAVYRITSQYIGGPVAIDCTNNDELDDLCRRLIGAEEATPPAPPA